MEGRYDETPPSETRSGVARGLAGIVLLGAVLGLAFNHLALGGKDPRGIAWIGADRTESLRAAGQVVAAEPDTAPRVRALPVSDDPLAIPSAASVRPGLPAIPDVGRPVEIELAAFKQYVDAGAALIVDARDAVEYREGRVPGAINLPFEQAITDPERLEALETGGRPVLVYCGGGSCEVSIDLAWELLSAGHGPVAVFTGGFPGWEEAGYPVERDVAALRGS